jgi:hypothetical protein
MVLSTIPVKLPCNKRSFQPKMPFEMTLASDAAHPTRNRVMTLSITMVERTMFRCEQKLPMPIGICLCDFHAQMEMFDVLLRGHSEFLAKRGTVEL